MKDKNVHARAWGKLIFNATQKMTFCMHINWQYIEFNYRNCRHEMPIQCI